MQKLGFNSVSDSCGLKAGQGATFDATVLRRMEGEVHIVIPETGQKVISGVRPDFGAVGLERSTSYQ